MSAKVPVARDHVWVRSSTSAWVYVGVNSSCYHQRPNGCTGSGLPPVAGLVFEGHATDGAIQTWVKGVAKWDPGIIPVELRLGPYRSLWPSCNLSFYWCPKLPLPLRFMRISGIWATPEVMVVFAAMRMLVQSYLSHLECLLEPGDILVWAADKDYVWISVDSHRFMLPPRVTWMTRVWTTT